MKKWNFLFIFNFLIVIIFILNIIVIRQIIGIVYLIFIPGLIIIKILQIKDLNILETMFFSIGLSISFLMFIGFFLNDILYSLNINMPLSETILISTIYISILIINIIGLYIETEKKKFYTDNKILKKINIRILSAYFIIPIIAIFASLYNNTIINILIIFFIAVTMYIVNMSFNIKTNINLYIIIFIISSSIILQRNFIGNYLLGYDIYFEYFISKLTYFSHFWNKYITNAFTERYVHLNSYNSMLSITILPTIFTNILKIPLIWTLKIIYPTLYIFVPLILFSAYRYLMNDKMAYLSIIFFMSSSKFLKQDNARQIIAEIFLSLLIYIMLNNNLKIKTKNILTIIFSFALIVSHYSLSYIFLTTIFILWIFKLLFEKRYNIKINYINTTQFLLILFFTFFWYAIYTTGPEINLINVGKKLFYSFIYDFWNLESRGKTIVTFVNPLIAQTLIQKIGNILPKILYFFLAIGALNYFIIKNQNNNFEIKFNWEYAITIIPGLGILAGIIILPGFATSFVAERWYHISVFTLSPFPILGVLTFSRFLNKRLIKPNKLNNKIIYNFICILLILNFLFKIGFIYEISGDAPESIVLSMKQMRLSEDIMIRARAYKQYIPEQDIYNSIWLSNHINSESNIYTDPITTYHDLIGYGDIDPMRIILLRNNINIPKNTYIYLSSANIINSKNFDHSNKICTNGKGSIYFNSYSLQNISISN